ncbi:Aste57867_18737 [Aphanomyces stellatus]|uniref:Aste57867_18737 protein n=1 Tax=Aphanomyces stellatus TaxID=120398 RepID=A0A485LBG2_9STRA|nr:hypothetical protein As57867_018673 [Aphanomyces stellatus]VFT95471.1 Aste57867_18737 [Aphanomyces stellatus]
MPDVSVIRMRHYENQNDHAAMVCLHTVALCLSASMTLVACATVFKWPSVCHTPTHGTLCMVFLSLGLWSLCKLGVIFTSHVVSPRGLKSTRHTSLLYWTAAADVCFNATSLWCILATYEFQCFVWRRRTTRTRVMTWYSLVVHAIGLAYLVAIAVLDANTPPRPPTTPRPPNATRGPGSRQWKPTPPLILTEECFWVIYAIRWVAVFYPCVLGVAFAMARDVGHRARSVHFFVALLVLLNLPYLVIEPLFDFDVLSKQDHLLVYSLAKCATYFSGVGMVNILGVYLDDFDGHYSPPTPKSSSVTRRSTDLAFMVFQSDRGSSVTMVTTRR